ncbi:MAG: hypothetical protein ACQET1_10220 [Gemmatimonadota bacterium]
MTAFLGILGAGALFALLGYSATRAGSRLGGAHGCHGDSCDLDSCSPDLDSCSLHEGCDGCGEEKSPAGWWPDGHERYGDRR